MLSKGPHLEYANSGAGGRSPALPGHYRWALRCQTIMIVNLPINGSSISNLIIGLTSFPLQSEGPATYRASRSKLRRFFENHGPWLTNGRPPQARH